MKIPRQGGDSVVWAMAGCGNEWYMGSKDGGKKSAARWGQCSSSRQGVETGAKWVVRMVVENPGQGGDSVVVVGTV